MNRSITLFEHHRRELETESAIDPEVIAERGYESIARPNVNDSRPRDRMKALGFPSWAIREDYFFPGLWMPMWSPTGHRLPGQWKPNSPVPDGKGRRMKYASAKGHASRLDVHPRWSRDRGQDDPALMPAIRDARLPLWITEGVKKADSLTSRGCVTIGLLGVYNWRSSLGTLGDWEDVVLRGREVFLCWDADAITKPDVAKAMERLGRWLRSKGVAKVWYVVVPPAVNGSAVKGVDDYFAAGGDIVSLEREAKTTPPRTVDTNDYFTDASMAEVIATEVLDGAFIWAAGMDWLGWDGRVWREVTEVSVIEAVRQFVRDRHAEAAARLAKNDNEAGALVEGWRGLLGSSRIRAVTNLARGVVERRAEEFDADPELVNTPGGVVNVETGEILPHDPGLLCTKITSGSYRKGFTHPDWTTALTALREDARDWFQIRMGQAVTGWTTSDGVVLILQGGGENGKSAVTTDGVLPALGSYGSVASPKLLLGSKHEHSTEMADLQGRRLVVVEELSEGQSIDVSTLKRLADVSRVRARRTHKDNMEFTASHTLVGTTNPWPVINETDHGTWRRLAMVVFPYRFRKAGESLEGPLDRPGDPTLKARITSNATGQHDAIVTWALEGAMAWAANRRDLEAGGGVDVMALPASVVADTLAWRKEADRVLAFWDEVICPDPDSDVLATDLVDRFNEWLAEGKHRPWSRETFASRFQSHTETIRHRVERVRKTRRVERVTRPPEEWFQGGPMPKQADLWRGVGWRVL